MWTVFSFRRVFSPVNMFFLMFAGAASLFINPAEADATPRPGPSAPLFNYSYYTCVKNYYVATNGNDANSGTSSSVPWATMQHANDVGRTAGDCVNVAPGTYTQGVLINSGGNTASATGYVVYRCSKMDACIVTTVSARGQNGAFSWDPSRQPMTGSYVMIDGFTVKASSETTFGQGVEIFDGNDGVSTAKNSVHHVWILNSVISGFGQSGIQMNDGEYFFVVHNTIFDNSRVGCSAQGSGVSLTTLKAFAGYSRTADDGLNKIVGRVGNFTNVIAYNVIYNNAITGCGTAGSPYNTDGNNIIIDTLNNKGSTNVVYPGSVLISYNITYNGGGRGIHIYQSENVTVANNSCYNSSLDPFDNGTYRPCIGDLNSYNIEFLNNISFGIAGSGNLAYNNAYAGGYAGSGTLDDFSNNMSYCAGSPSFGCNTAYNGDSFSCTANFCGTNPLWVSVGTQSVGTETVRPVSTNFALQSGSPAIGRGVRRSFLPPQSVDLGACPSKWTVCP